MASAALVYPLNQDLKEIITLKLLARSFANHLSQAQV
jgi:hypothetical protein